MLALFQYEFKEVKRGEEWFIQTDYFEEGKEGCYYILHYVTYRIRYEKYSIVDDITMIIMTIDGHGISIHPNIYDISPVKKRKRAEEVFTVIMSCGCN